MLSPPDRPPFEWVPAMIARDDPLADVLLVCDHASNAVPREIGTLGLDWRDMQRHIAYDVGAREVTIRLADALGVGAVMTTFSRLVIDPNRAEVDPTLVMKIYDGSIIPGNRRVDAAETARRLDLWHRPYHRAIGARLDEIVAAGGEPVLVSVHSFTPRLRGRPMRPWHIGLLWDRDDRLVRPLLGQLRNEAGLVVGDNQPYSGALAGDCMSTHGTGRGIPHVLIEIRNDLITDGDGQAFWAALLAPKVRETIMEMRLAAAYGRWI